MKAFSRRPVSLIRKTGRIFSSISPTNAWFGRTSAPYQHLSMTVFRAVENRLYLVRAANTGITAFVDPLGTIVSQTGLFEKVSLSGTVRFMNRGTLYGRLGDAFVGACGVVFITMVIIVVFRRKER